MSVTALPPRESDLSVGSRPAAGAPTAHRPCPGLLCLIHGDVLAVNVARRAAGRRGKTLRSRKKRALNPM
eukprot:6962468-Prymnesium_polylepis.1